MTQRTTPTTVRPATMHLGVALVLALGCPAVAGPTQATAQRDGGHALAFNRGGPVFDTIAELRAAAVQGQRVLAHVLGYAALNDGGGGLFYWDAESGAAVDDGLVFSSTFPGAAPAGRWMRVFCGPVDAAWWGMSGDGSNETAALQAAFHAAAGRGITFREPRVFGFQGVLSVPQDVRVQNNGATLQLLSDPGGASTAISLGPRFRADLLRVHVAPGVAVRRLISVGDENDIEQLVVTSAGQQANTSHSLDAALQIRSSAVRIGQVKISGFDNAGLLYQAQHVSIGNLKIEDYTNGLHVRECTFVNVMSGAISNPSPAATTVPGHNGLLFETSADVVVSDVIVHDAGEHAIRIGGSGNSARFVFNNIQAIRPGQCGLKINPNDGLRVRDVQINGLTVVDAAATSTPGSNEDGLRLEKCTDVTVNGFQVEKRDRAVSGYDGIYINACDFVTINGPKIADVAANGIHLIDLNGAVNEIFINNPSILFTGNDGILIESPVHVLRDITVMRCFIRGHSGWGIRIDANSPTVGVNQPVILDGWIKNGGLGGVAIDTSDNDIHTTISLVN